MRTLLSILCLALLAAPQTLTGQTRSSTIRGEVRGTNGRPIAEAVVFVLETLEEARSDAEGRFLLRSAHVGVATIAARRVGFVPSAIDLTLPADTTLQFTLRTQPPTLTSVTVVAAGEYTLGNGNTATLSPLEVAQTPGAAANVARAIQTLPGVQGVDEGTGLFVRGGDVSETRVLIDDLTFLSPVRFDNPTGHVTSTVDPFLLERTVFSAGGFGAQYGNALSGVVRMETAGRPTSNAATLNASIGALGAAAAWRVRPTFGMRVAAKVTSLAPLLNTFGEAQPYEPAPKGGDVSASLEWQSSASGRIKLFALQQEGEFGVGNASVAGAGGYSATSRERMFALSWRDSSRSVRPSVAIGRSAFVRDENVNGYALATELGTVQGLASLSWIVRDGWQWRGGVEFERLDARYAGAAAGSSAPPDFDARPRIDRSALWSDASYESIHGVRVVVGLRSDDATLVEERSVDPRISVAWQRRRLGLTAAWGRYTQVAEPTFYRPAVPGTPFAPMRAEQSIVGLQWGSDTLGLRAELYEKRYASLWQFDRDFTPVGGGRGRARGADLLVRWQPFPSTTTRLSWSTVSSTRTDPNSGTMARAIGDLTHSVTWVTETRLRTFTIGTARRWATGRPFTDVVGTTPSPGGPLPVWGEANAERMPHYGRFDISLSWYRGLGEGRGLVLFGSAANVFDQNNVMRYRWTADYSTRLPVRAPFNRSVYAGASLLL